MIFKRYLYNSIRYLVYDSNQHRLQMDLSAIKNRRKKEPESFYFKV